ncbi:vitamin K-dependent gamma-carboxylase [Lingula anatina]|uniref:Vitamin K-dependent gamma-carboxylase n=1 Tax=Lingula anatina TaxID=7574 RepID=A0A2R2MQJ1_LINAN|nr:vitamin K-dependent gamma-carboxylase [Lingula anatina]|eukprot:XP_023932515.1 vitamin K-dependent gamma-carboxylase [Lingula anatina]
MKKSKEEAGKEDKMKKLLGFTWEDISSWNAFVRLLSRPSDPALLGLVRALYGFLMVLDIPQERGLASAYAKFGDSFECRFPLFNFLEPMSMKWMYLVYLTMLAGACGIMLGMFYRLSCLMFVCSYWYVYLLDKTVWNNHSYLYGLIGIQLLFMDANRYWSVDGLLRPSIRNAHVPLWNYTLIRTQWLFSICMHQFILTDEQIDLYVVHLGGLTIDLFIGFVYFFDATRPIGFVIGSLFHLMNSQMFSIGMFPWTMLATQPVFCHMDLPRRLFRKMPCWLTPVLPLDTEAQPSGHCLYSKEVVKPEDQQNIRTDERENGHQPTKNGSSSRSENNKQRRPLLHSSPQFFHKMAALCVVSYISTQCFLPYSHFLTKGYNNWTNGLYGYSWDMMVHTWSSQHIRITYVNKETGEVGYLNPRTFTGSKRWASHADMLKQFSTCILDRLKLYNLTNIELTFDIWKSMNNRFQQRMFDPRVDILTAEWHPFKATSWLMPLLVDLSDWRAKMDEIEDQIYNNTNTTTDVVFVADFPGLHLENFVQADLGNTSLTVLKGEVVVELVEEKKNRSLKEGDTMKLPPGKFHNVYTVSETPSCYMYLFCNTTEDEFLKNVTEYEQQLENENRMQELAQEVETGVAATSKEDDPQIQSYRQALKNKLLHQMKQNSTFWQRSKQFWAKKYSVLKTSVTMTKMALQSFWEGRPMEELLAEMPIEDDPAGDVMTDDDDDY